MRRKWIYRILNDLGVSCDLKGRGYIEYALEQILVNGHMSMSKELYPAMAIEFNVSASRIERGIRFAIEKTFQNCPPDVLQSYFGNTIDYCSGKLTNVQFLYGVAKYIETFGMKHKGD